MQVRFEILSILTKFQYAPEYLRVGSHALGQCRDGVAISVFFLLNQVRGVTLQFSLYQPGQ